MHVSALAKAFLLGRRITRAVKILIGILEHEARLDGSETRRSRDDLGKWCT